MARAGGCQGGMDEFCWVTGWSICAQPWRMTHRSGRQAFQPERTLWGKARQENACSRALWRVFYFLLLTHLTGREFCFVTHKMHEKNPLGQIRSFPTSNRVMLLLLLKHVKYIFDTTLAFNRGYAYNFGRRNIFFISLCLDNSVIFFVYFPFVLPSGLSRFHFSIISS